MTLLEPPAAITVGGLKLAVRPPGIDEVLMVTLLARLPADTTMESLIVDPAVTLRVAVAGDRNRDGSGIFSSTGTDEVALPEVPVISTVNRPVVTAAFGVKVTMLVPVALIDVALNETFNPLGAPEADNVTFPGKPISLEMPIVVVMAGPPTRRFASVREAARVSAG